MNPNDASRPRGVARCGCVLGRMLGRMLGRGCRRVCRRMLRRMRCTMAHLCRTCERRAPCVRRTVNRLEGLRRQPYKLAILVLIALLTVYWSLIASPRYVSETAVVVQRNGDSAGTPSPMLSLMTGGNAEASDMLLLRERLLSADVLLFLNAQLGLSAHYSDRKRDAFSRLGEHHPKNERLIAYLKTRIDVVYDDYASLLRIRAQGFSPEMAQKMTQLMRDEGERFVNQLANQQAAEQHRFIDTQLAQFQDRAEATRNALLAFQNQYGLASPAATAESVAQVIARLDHERAELSASKNMLAVYLTPQAPEMIKVNAQLTALSKQIETERARLTQPSHTRQAERTSGLPPDAARLNTLAAQQAQLQSDATFADELYATSRAALERARIESIRKLKTLAVIQAPTLPQESTQPRRAYAIVIWTLSIALAAALFSLVRAIVREHRD